MKAKLLQTGLFMMLLSVQVYAQSNLWAMSRKGGNYDKGCIFSMDPSNGAITVHHSFQSPDGYHPYGNLLQANDGNIYGTCYTESGPSCTLFRFEPVTNSYTDVYNFDIIYGDNPMSGLIQGPNNILYGVTTGGGLSGVGVLYSWNTFTNTYTVIHNFNSATGGGPHGEPMLHSNGKIYGMTYFGGQYNKGVLYSYNLSTSTYTALHHFDGFSGYHPKGSLLEASNGLLYGMAPDGGASFDGVLFSFDPVTNSMSKKVDFYQTLGTWPQGTLIQASNGLLYGTLADGGIYMNGTLFSYDIQSNTCSKIFDFNSIDGEQPVGDLYEYGIHIYGLATYGGAYAYGTAYRVDIANNAFTKLADLSGATGRYPNGAFDILVPTGIPAIQQESIGIYPNPAENILMVNLPGVNTSDYRIRVFDLAGKLIIEKSNAVVVEQTVNLDLQSLHSGMYFLQLDTGDKTYKQEFVKY